MEVARALGVLGGVASTADLLHAVSRHQLDLAIEHGEVLRVARGRFVLPGIDDEVRAATSLSGALGLVSAARRHGWGIKLPPARPQVVVPRGRNVTTGRRRGVELHWGEVTTGELAAGVTSPIRTVLDCARLLPLDDALAVADSALRAGMSRSTLLFAASRLPRTGRSRAYRVVELADARAANPFESVLRAVLLDVPGLALVPQVWIAGIGRADLVDERLGLAVEGDSFEFHSSPAALLRDMVRYNAFVAARHTVLRFGWRHAMFEQDYVRTTVAAVVADLERSVRRCRGCRAA